MGSPPLNPPLSPPGQAQEGGTAWIGAVLLRFHDQAMRPTGMACVPAAFLAEGAGSAAATAAREAATALGSRLTDAWPSGANDAASQPQPQPPVVPASGSAVQVDDWPVQWVPGVTASAGGSLWLVLRSWTAGAFARQAHAPGLTADGRLVPASQLPGRGGGGGGSPRARAATLAASTEVFTGDPPAQGGGPQLRVAPGGGGRGERGRVVRFPSWLRLATACRMAAYGRLGGGGLLELVVNVSGVPGWERE